MRGPLPWRFVEFDRMDPGAYGRWFRGMWAERRTFVICEQDVVPAPDQLADMGTCGHDWCYTEYQEGIYPPGPMFGLVRFSARIMREHPHAAECALVIGMRRDQEAPWWQVDGLVARDLQIRLGQGAWSLHPGQVRHLHVGPPSGPAG